MIVFTSVTKNYIPKARVLARSLKRFHPDWKFRLLLADELPANFDREALTDFDGVVSISDLALPANLKAWLFKHSLVELCTALKGPAAQFLRTQTDKLIYLDPDIKVYGDLNFLSDLLDRHDVVLTPHLLVPETAEPAIRDNEVCALQHGVFNLGFFGMRTSGDGARFIDWWTQRLLHYCVDDIPAGLFTDQRWCDLVPCFFENTFILRDPGCNVATWNIAHRPVSQDGAGQYWAGDVPLRWYHFTGFDNGTGWKMLHKYAPQQLAAHELWRAYASELNSLAVGHDHWAYGCFDNGDSIPPEARALYRRRADLQQAFPNPFQVEGHSYWRWWNTQRHSDAGRTPPLRFEAKRPYSISLRPPGGS